MKREEKKVCEVLVVENFMARHKTWEIPHTKGSLKNLISHFQRNTSWLQLRRGTQQILSAIDVRRNSKRFLTNPPHHPAINRSGNTTKWNFNAPIWQLKFNETITCYRWVESVCAAFFVKGCNQHLRSSLKSNIFASRFKFPIRVIDKLSSNK